MKAIASPLEASLKQNYKFGNFTVVPEAGFEVAEFLKRPDQLPTPFVFRVAGAYQDAFPVEGVQLKWKLAIKAGFNLGLSKKGWAWIAKKVGGEVLKRFLAQAGAQLARVGAYLVAEGILAAGGVAVAVTAFAVGTTALVAYLAVETGRQGQVRGVVAWYYTAYVNKVFRKGRPTGVVQYEYARMRDDLVKAGEADAVNAAFKGVGGPGTLTEEAALDAYRNALIEKYGSEANAIQQLTYALRVKVEQEHGL